MVRVIVFLITCALGQNFLETTRYRLSICMHSLILVKVLSKYIWQEGGEGKTNVKYTNLLSGVVEVVKITWAILFKHPTRTTATISFYVQNVQ